MLLYLDLNCFNRPFDDQRQQRVARIVDGVDRLVWSAVLDFENAQHPLVDRRTEIGRWAQRAAITIPVNEEVSARAHELTAGGLRPLDAAHIACAEAAACDRFLTCDAQLFRRSRQVPPRLHVQNPIDYVKEQADG